MVVNKIVLRTEDNKIGLDIREDEGGVLLISAIRCNENYMNPVIPDGFEHLKGEWNTGFTIINKIDKSEFVWVPAGMVESDGTLDGVHFNEKFGRRKFQRACIFSNEYHEEVDTEMVESIKKYGGYYIAAFSAHEENERIVSQKGKDPKVYINWMDAKKYAEDYAKDNPSIVSCMPSGAAYDTLFKWIIQSGEKTFEEVTELSTSWGNFREDPKPTGSDEKNCVYNIYDLAGNVSEWSTEMVGSWDIVLRGGIRYSSPSRWAAACRYPCRRHYTRSDVSFRLMLYLK